ncbi:hypothetical protein chiPu_0012585 [Chiloscyllium punctatum]|uniref:Uncharacterized protein n=1 Tax=Chiloscyllium punctatum TaxID=137246 RepID=A0A401SUP9_CHIPU|nr:hypothetical protein [Chiloscyllium punctatum]
MSLRKKSTKCGRRVWGGPAGDPDPSDIGLAGERQRRLLQHELVNLQQMNLSLQAVLQMVVSFNKIIEEVSQNTHHLTELNGGWSTFFRAQK